MALKEQDGVLKGADMTNLTRSPAVAGRFYPGDAESLRLSIQEMSREAPTEKKKVLAAISPHAGYVYSGAVAAKTLGAIKIPETVILLGPNHTGQGAPVGLSTRTWEMVMGDVPVDQHFIADLLSETDYVEKDELAHQ